MSVKKLKEIPNSNIAFPEIDVQGIKEFKLNHMDVVDDSEVKKNDSKADICGSNATSFRSHHSVNYSSRKWKITINLLP